jgi:hypothetical protein
MTLAHRYVGLIASTLVFAACGTGQVSEERTGLPDLDAVDASEIVKIGFKEWLKQEGHSMDIRKQNPHETFQPGNLYSNHYYNLVIDFPDTWESDRGAGPYTLFRAYEGDSAMSISLQVTTANITGREKSKMSADEHEMMENAPIEFMKRMIPEGYGVYMERQLKQSSGMNPIDFEFFEKRMGTMVYIVSRFKTKEWMDDLEFYVMNESWAANKWGNTYTISYSAPDFFFNPNLVSQVAHQAQFMNPKFLKGKP